MAKAARRKPMSEINVVPYIDVMLVLLVIFMVTAPLMTQGIKVELPAADSEAIEVSDPDDFLVVSIDAEDDISLIFGRRKRRCVARSDGIADRKKVVTAQPSIKVLIEGDQAVTYGYVMSAMDRLKNAGIEDVGAGHATEDVGVSDASISDLADDFALVFAWSGAWVVASQLGVAASQVASIEHSILRQGWSMWRLNPNRQRRRNLNRPRKSANRSRKRYRF